LLQGLIDQADESDAPQMVTRLNDPGKGRTWAAWPFRTLQRRGILAGGAIEASEAIESWRRMLQDLSDVGSRGPRPVRAELPVDTHARASLAGAGRAARARGSGGGASRPRRLALRAPPPAVPRAAHALDALRRDAADPPARQRRPGAGVSPRGGAGGR